MAAAQSPEQRELSLVGKVEMRIALTDTDAKLESMLATYLPPLLLKLASEHQSVRTKVISVCQHVNTRIKPQSIQLPVAALVKQFKENDNALIRHFDFLYIQQGVGRLSNAAKGDLLPVVVNGIAKSGSHGPQIFNLFLRLLGSYSLPLRGSKEDLELRSRMAVQDEDTEFLATYVGKLILFIPPKQKAPSRSPGLSDEDQSFLSLQGKDDVWNPAAGGLNALQTKIFAIRLMGSGLFNDKERFLPGFFASADAASTISDVGDDVLKRSLPVADLEDETLIRHLFDLYRGSSSRARVLPALRVKILGLLSKSINSTTFATAIAEVVEDGFWEGDETPTDVSKLSVREASKLRSALLAYINFVARNSSVETLQPFAHSTIRRLRSFVENQGWPQPGPSEDLVSRGYVYEVIGLLAKASPRGLLVDEETASLDLLRWLFTSLAEDSSSGSIVVSIEESLSTILGALARLHLSEVEQSVLEDLLAFQMEQSADLTNTKRLRSTRYVAVRFANRCLPYSSVKARWVDVLGLGASKDRPEVREEAERGLSPYWYRMLNGSVDADKTDPPFPIFVTLMQQFFRGRTTSSTTEPMAVARDLQQAHPNSFKVMISFARRILFAEALRKANVAVDQDSEWERRIDVAVEGDINARDAVKAHLRALAEHLDVHLRILLCAFFASTITSTTDTDTQLVDFLSLAPDALVRILVLHAEMLLPVLQSNQQDRRAVAAQAYGILASHPHGEVAKKQDHVQKLQATCESWKTAVGAGANHTHGAILALGFLFSRSAYRGQTSAQDEQYRKFTKTILDVLSNTHDNLLKQASYAALGQLCMYGCITPEDIQADSNLRVVVDAVYKTAKEGNETAILCLGQMSMIFPETDADDSDLAYLEKQLHQLHEIKQAEVHFTVGEALSYVTSGWQSGALATKLDIDGPPPSSKPRSITLPKLIDKTLTDCSNTKPSLKKAAVIWLLTIIEYCGEQTTVQERLPSFQAAFKRCLSDRDELVQETASRGLGLVYEKGNRHLKDDLVRDLVSSFSSDKQSQLAGNVSADTQLFEPGALPTGEGSISTYKDIMSLASEVGDSSLVYRFMSMASANAIWSTRAAFGRFGLSNVLSDSSVDGYLADNPKLYPKLFRYRFDPNSGVQRSMNDIWNALVKDTAATVDKHFDAIMEDLLTSILGKEWRVRQASCAAIADLVSGRPLDKYEQYLERIWTQCFKVLDDIKESVRAAAASLARSMTGVLTRALEADHSSTKNASAMLKHVLPFLLSPSGMESSAQEVQAFAVHTLLEIIKKSNGKTLRPFIPELVERLIGLLSTLEPEAVNYVHMNASKYNLTEQKIDDMRLSSVRSSPLMEAIERCLDLLDDDSMRDLQPRLENAMKTAVGLPSKVGSSRVLVSLSTRRTMVFRPYADDFLRVIEKLVLDRNQTVSSSHAMAAGYIARAASDKQILRLVTFAKRLYFESEGDREATIPRRSITAGELLFAMTKHASDRFNSLASAVLPFVYFGKHDSNDQVKEQFQNTWDESVGGSRAVLLYLEEIVELCLTHLDSPQWALKHTSARTISDTVSAVSALESKMSENVGAQLWPTIEKALSGKTWEGKEVVLLAFVKFVETAQSYYLPREDVKAAISKIVVREAKRQNAVYRPHAVKALGEIALARVDVDLSETVFDIVTPLLAHDPKEDAMDIDEGESQKPGDTILASRVAAISALFASINPLLLQGGELTSILLKAFRLAAATELRSADVQRALYGSLAKAFDRVQECGKGVQLDDMDTADLESILFGPSINAEALRLLRADAVLAVGKTTPAVLSKMRVALAAVQQSEVSAVVLDRLAAAANA